MTDKIESTAKVLSGAELVALCREAALKAMEEDQRCQEVQLKHFEEAIKQAVSRITPEMLKFYEDYANKSGVASI